MSRKRISFKDWKNMTYRDILKLIDDLNISVDSKEILRWYYITALRGNDLQLHALKMISTTFLRGKPVLEIDYIYYGIDDWIEYIKNNKTEKIFTDLLENVNEIIEKGLFYHHWFEHILNALEKLDVYLDLENDLQTIIESIHIILYHLNKYILLDRERRDINELKEWIIHEIERIKQIIK